MIAIDTTFFAHTEAASGVLSLSTSIFTADLLDAFARSGRAGDFALVVSENHEEFFHRRFPKYRLIAARWPVASLLRKATRGRVNATRWVKTSGAYRRAVRQSGATTVWFPFATPRTFVETGLPVVVTVHDLYRLHHGTHKDAECFRQFLSEEANTIVCVSDATRQDVLSSVLSAAQSASQKVISVIPNSVDLDTSEQEPMEGLADKGYILDINAYIDKKNPMTLLAAYDLIKSETPLPLVFCGGYKDDECFARMQSYVAERGLGGRVHTLFRVPSAQRNWLLTHAALFVTPSLYEGWGRTPVEAAICRVPVISTKETSLKEATMGLVRYVDDPMSAEELAGAMREVLAAPPSADDLQRISDTLQSAYSPDKCAAEYLRVFDAM